MFRDETVAGVHAMPEVFDVRGVLAPEDTAQDALAWLSWVGPAGMQGSAEACLAYDSLSCAAWLALEQECGGLIPL